MQLNERRAVLILRLWQDRTSPTGAWRSEIVHVQSGARAHCADLDALFGHVASFLHALEAEDLTTGGLD